MNDDLLKQDLIHRELALDTRQSFIVQAPAGSGKTELLIQRFLSLLGEVTMPEEILAITFTKKAANEMRERILHALLQARSSPEPETSHQKKTWLLAKKVLTQDALHQWNLLQCPNQLRIQTIDSFCAYLTKQLPLLAHFGSQPDIAEQPDFLYREAVQEVLSHLEEAVPWATAISILLKHLNNDLNKLCNLLVHLLHKRDQWLSYLHLNTSDQIIREKLESQLALIVQHHLSQLCTSFPKEYITELMTIVRFAANGVAYLQSASPLLVCQDQVDLPAATLHDLPMWLGIANLLLTQNGTWRKRADQSIGFLPSTTLHSLEEKTRHKEYKQRWAALIENLSPYEALRNALAELSYLPKPHYEESQWEVLHALLQVLKITAAQLRLSFQQHGKIDYIENTQAALLALGEAEQPTDLALTLDYQIRHILVDEFQDTSFTQYQLLEKLTYGWERGDGRTLFVVGDPMQSIYRFREAEVGLFMRMQETGLGHLTLTRLTLTTNFRSTATIVKWNNTHFHAIFPTRDDIATGAVRYTPSVATEKPLTNPTDTYVRIQADCDATEHTQATAIVTAVQELKQYYPHEKIAILVRSRTHLNAIIPALKTAKIKYKAVDIDPLATRPCIQDLLSLTCALLHPADRIAWLAILRAPWCGFTLKDLHCIANRSPTAIILNELEDDALYQMLSIEGQQRLKYILPILKNKIVNRERYALRTWIESTWIALGGPAGLKDQIELEDVNAFFTLLESINDHTTLCRKKLEEKIHILYAAAGEDDSLQIMTIHSAKGLEFDTVILPHLERKNINDTHALLSWIEQPLGKETSALLLAPLHAMRNDDNILYAYIQRLKKMKADFEKDRLLYVATTRAIKRLYLYCSLNETDNGEYRIATASFLEKLWPLIGKSNDIMMTKTSAIEEKNDQASLRHRLMRLSSDWINPIQDIPLAQTAHQQIKGFSLLSSQATSIGTVTHQVLQMMGKKGIDAWTQKNKLDQHHYLHFHLKHLGMNEEDLPAAINHIVAMVNNILQDPHGQWILQPHIKAQSEYALTALIDDRIHHVIIDRTFIDESGHRWIIDYKTTPLLPSVELAIFLKKEKKKYSEKMLHYAQTLKQIEDRPTHLGLYFLAIPAWIAW